MNISKMNNNGKLAIPPAPLMFFLDLTERCNLRCWFCYNGIERHKENANFDDIISILDIMHAVGCDEVTYLGGEPTIHPKIFEILDYADNLGMSQSMVSNGQIIDCEFASKLSQFKDFEIGISIHSVKAEIQNTIAGSKKSFANIERAITALEENKISWYSQTSLVKDNYLELKEIWRYLLSKGNPTRMDLSRMVVGDISTDRFLNEKEYIKVFEQINLIDTEKLPIRIEAFPRCWLKMIANNHKLDYDRLKRAVRPCYAWTAQISIDIHGNVRLCPTGGKVAGNILKKGIDAIWKKNKIMQEFQNFQWQRPECLECDDFVFCGGACKMTCSKCSPTSDEYIIKGGMANVSINE